MSANSGIVYLMYHELELPGRALCQNEPGYVRYIVTASDFCEQMRRLKHSGWHGMSVSEALAQPRLPGVAVTFDDGCETDLITAAPLLLELGFSATFYITVGFLDRPGYLSRAQLFRLGSLGFEIGSHSLTHPYLSDLPREQLVHEIAHSRQELEQITGRPVVHFSCPGGRWSPLVAATAREAGYHSVATSRAAANTARTDAFALGRVPIMRGTSLTSFQDLSGGHGLFQIQLRNSARAVLKRVLGNSFYDRLRERALHHRAP